MLKMQIIGHCGADAEIKSSNGKEFMKVSVASTEKRGDKEVTTWVDIISGLTKLQPHLTKGKQIYASGTPSFSSYNDKPQITLNNPEIQLL